MNTHMVSLIRAEWLCRGFAIMAIIEFAFDDGLTALKNGLKCWNWKK